MKLQEELTELGNAKLFVKIADGDFRWLHENKNWINWNNNKWNTDKDGKAVRTVELILEYLQQSRFGIIKEIAEEMKKPDADTAGSDVAVKITALKAELKEITTWWKASQRQSVIRATMGLAQTQENITVCMDDVDNHPLHLGVKNGVVDIKTGELLTGGDAKNLMIMQEAGVSYNKDATYKEWEAMILKLMMGDESVAKFMKVLLGSALLGFNSKYFTFIHGSGSNGKTTVQEVVSRIMGDYSFAGDVDLFMKGSKKNKEYYFAKYHGKRLLVFNEIDKDQVNLSEDLIKQTTDSGALTGRHPSGQPFTYEPQFTPIFSVNHLPTISNDKAVWRRTVIVPFEYVVQEHEKEEGFVNRMVTECGSGILNWLLDGSKIYLEEGLVIPQKLIDFTDAQKKETDVLDTFLLEWIAENAPNSNFKMIANDLRLEFVAYCTRHGYTRDPGIKLFCGDLRAADLIVKTSTGNKTFIFGLGNYIKPTKDEKLDNNLLSNEAANDASKTKSFLPELLTSF